MIYSSYKNQSKLMKIVIQDYLFDDFVMSVDRIVYDVHDIFDSSDYLYVDKLIYLFKKSYSSCITITLFIIKGLCHENSSRPLISKIPG